MRFRGNTQRISKRQTIQATCRYQQQQRQRQERKRTKNANNNDHRVAMLRQRSHKA